MLGYNTIIPHSCFDRIAHLEPMHVRYSSHLRLLEQQGYTRQRHVQVISPKCQESDRLVQNQSMFQKAVFALLREKRHLAGSDYFEIRIP